MEARGCPLSQERAPTHAAQGHHKGHSDGVHFCVLKTMWWFLTSALANPVVEVFVNNQSIAQDRVTPSRVRKSPFATMEGVSIDRPGMATGVEMTTGTGLGRSQPLSVHDAQAPVGWWSGMERGGSPVGGGQP